MTPSIALTSTRLRSCARMLALAFLVPNVSPSKFLACLYSCCEGAEAGILFRDFTVLVKMCGVIAVGSMFNVEFRLLCTAIRYLNNLWEQQIEKT